jgi:hypothetical protein
MRWFAWTVIAVTLLVGRQDGARAFVTTRVPVPRLGFRHMSMGKLRKLRMCADDGRRSGFDQEIRVIDPSGNVDKGEGGRASPQPSDRLEDATRKTEMWKELWIRNVGSSDTSGKRTSQVFRDAINGLRSKLFRPNDHYEEVRGQLLQMYDA